MSDLSERFALAVAQAPREYVIAVFARALGLSIEEARRRLDEAMQPGTLTLQELMGFEDMSVGIAYLSVTNIRIKDVFDRTHPRA